MTAAPEKLRLRQIRTPEGFALPFTLARFEDRMMALFLDFLVIVGCTIGALMLAGALAALGLPSLGGSFALGASFFLWNFYFVFAEARRGGTTIGKRALKIRVIAREGGPLRFEAIFARNVMRNLELFLPLIVLLAPQAIFGSVPAWGRWIAVLWVFTFAFFPLFNRDRLRCGDLVGGTIVVRQPVSMLLTDLAAEGSPGRGARGPAAAPEFSFTPAQLGIYGIKELQVLEDLLRRANQGILEDRVLFEVFDRIQNKIRWTERLSEAQIRPFLEAFYRAQRAHLEQRMLFGQRRESKTG